MRPLTVADMTIADLNGLIPVDVVTEKGLRQRIRDRALSGAVPL